MPDTKIDSDSGKLNTFGGVFLPNVLTILGVVMFLRTGWVVGQSGLLGALTILVLAKSITILTTMSLSAIATNTRVGAGGAYFMVSRSLGLEIGGSVGVPLYFAQAISVAFYIVGFTESLQFIWPDIDPRVAGTCALAVFASIAWFGATLVTRTQYFIFGALILSLISFFVGRGSPPIAGQDLMHAEYSEGMNLWAVFAIFFPAVTGIMAGVSMSGDLKEPSRSIPRGTLAAVLVTFVVYAGQMVWLSLNATRENLLTNNMVMLDIAWFPTLIIAGLWAASLSSALSSLAAAPRTLQALGRDAVAPRIFGVGQGKNREPHNALILTVVVAEACILLGDLNLIAPIITMFFLATYSTINLVAGLERLVNNPSFRPSFAVHWIPSLIGCFACVAAMFLINPLATLLAGVIILSIYLVLTNRRMNAAWGDMRSGMWFALTRFGLLQFQASRQHHRNWRPIILVLAGNPKTRKRLVHLAQRLEARRGMLFLAQVVTGDRDKLLERRDGLQESLELFIRNEKLAAVGKTVVADDFENGVLSLLQVGGLGQFEPNTVLMGWSEDALKQAGFARAVRHILQLRRNLVILVDAQENTPLNRFIDVWWYAKDNGSLMVTLAHLLRTGSSRWANHPIRVRRIISEESAAENARQGTARLLEESRISVQIDIIVSRDPPMEVIVQQSKHSEFVFLGVALDDNNSDSHWLDRYGPVVEAMDGNLMLTKSWQDLRLDK